MDKWFRILIYEKKRYPTWQTYQFPDQLKNPAASCSPPQADSTVRNSVNFLIRSLTPQSAKALWRTGNALAVAVQLKNHEL